VLPIRHYSIDRSHGELRARYVCLWQYWRCPQARPTKSRPVRYVFLSSGPMYFRRRGEAFQYMCNAISQPSV